MRISAIFDEQLYACHHPGEKLHELDRLMELWTDVGWLYSYAQRESVPDPAAFIDKRLREAEFLQDLLERIRLENELFSSFFRPLQELESRKSKLLPLHKGKIPGNSLRIYAIRIESDCFLITGGAIKMSQRMQDPPDTARELAKLQEVRSFLIGQGVFDDSSFFELILELT